MKYLAHKRKPSRKAHIWGGTDTLCHAYKNGVIHPNSSFVVVDAPGAASVCDTCRRIKAKSERKAAG